jgi:hypothetical protein
MALAAIPWKYTGEGSIEGSIETEQLLSPDDEGFAGGYDYEETEPEETWPFTARGLIWSEVDALRTKAKLRLEIWNITDTNGNEWSGLRKSFSWKPITGTGRFEVSLTLKAPATAPSDP